MSLTYNLRFGTKEHDDLRDYLLEILTAHGQGSSTVKKNLDKDEALFYGYVESPTNERTERPATNEQKQPEYKTIRIPYTYAAAMTAHTYITSVFLSRTPVFQVQGRHGTTQDKELAMEAYLDYQTVSGDNIPVLYNWLMDPFRYGFGVVGAYWTKDVTTIGKIVDLKEQLSDILPGLFPKSKKQYIEIPLTTYLGNKVYNVRPHDFIWDTRYNIVEFQRGEYAGEYTEMSLNSLSEGVESGTHIKYNVDMFKKIAAAARTTARPTGNELAAEEPGKRTWITSLIIDWRNNKKTAHCIQGVDLYVKLIPADWGLGKSKKLTLWYFVLGEEKVILSARPVSDYHGRFPYSALSYDIDYYKLAPRSMTRVVEPLEDSINWLINQHFYNVRKHLNNSAIVDPSMLVLKDLYNRSAYIRKRPEAFGKDPKDAYKQIESTDITRAHLSDIRLVQEFTQGILGVNDNVMGMVNPGGRKTAAEVRTSSSFSTNRLKTVAEWFSATGFSSLSRMLIINSQQYMDEPLKLRIAGDLARGDIAVDPETISGFYEFAPIDGTMPVDRYAVANMMRDLAGTMMQVPELMQQYDILSLFEYIAILSGAKNISRFRVQVQPDQTVMDQAQAGNVVPIQQPSRGAGGPSQIAGMGNI